MLSSASVTSVVCHEGLDLALCGRADGLALVVSASNGQVVQSLPGHRDAVTSVALNPHGEYEVVTGCHDGIVRLFDLRRASYPLQAFPMHRHKFDEAVHAVSHWGDLIITAGADASIGVLAPNSWQQLVNEEVDTADRTSQRCNMLFEDCEEDQQHDT